MPDPASPAPAASSGPASAAPSEDTLAATSPPRSGHLEVLERPAETDWQMLAPQSVTAERIASWIVALMLIVLGGIVLATALLTSAPGAWWSGLWLGLYALAVLGLIWAAHFLPSLAYRHTRYQLSEVGFEIRRGILWRSLITVPHARVQHTDVAQGPLQRSFDIGKLILYTAGTQHASVELNGLPFQRACELRDILVGRREASDGV